MFKSLENVDWNLLHQQKLALLALRNQQRQSSPEAESLSGIIHLLDALQDDAETAGLWTFPEETEGGAS